MLFQLAQSLFRPGFISLVAPSSILPPTFPWIALTWSFEIDRNRIYLLSGNLTYPPNRFLPLKDGAGYTNLAFIAHHSSSLKMCRPRSNMTAPYEYRCIIPRIGIRRRSLLVKNELYSNKTTPFQNSNSGPPF